VYCIIRFYVLYFFPLLELQPRISSNSTSSSGTRGWSSLFNGGLACSLWIPNTRQTWIFLLLNSLTKESLDVNSKLYSSEKTSLTEFLKAKKTSNHVSSSKVIEHPTESSRMCAPWWIESHDKNSQPRS